MTIDNYISMETTTIDYKEQVEVKKARSWLKSVSAFANTGIGKIIFGIRDADLAKVGLENCQQSGEKITELINARIQPIPDYDIQYETDNGKEFIILTVRKGVSTPYYYTHDGTKVPYVRKGNQTVEAPNHELNGLILNGRGITYDTLPSPYRLEDVSFTLLEATYNNTVGIDEKFDKTRDLVSFGLITAEGTVTNAGALLCDQGILRHSRVFCTRWKGTIKGSVDLDAIDDKEYSGSLITLLENAVTFVMNNSRKSWTIKGLVRDESVDYPYRAVREVIVNALIHRDYQIVGSEIHIDMYDDRLEVYSPGGMANGWRIQDLNLLHVPSIRRNPIISDVFGRMRLMDRKESGIQRIISAYDVVPDLMPMFSSEAAAFFVELPNMTYFLENKKSADKKSADKKVTEKTKQHLNTLYTNMDENTEYTVELLCGIVGLKESRTKQLLRILCAQNKVEKLGANRNKRYKRKI